MSRPEFPECRIAYEAGMFGVIRFDSQSEFIAWRQMSWWRRYFTSKYRSKLNAD